MAAERLFLDTAFVQALLNRRDSQHHLALRLFPRVQTAREVWVTEAVLVEIGNALSAFNRSAAVRFIDQCYHTYNIRVIPVDTELFRESVAFYRSHTDKAWGLTDCISFVVMQQQGLSAALTSDQHFEQAGFRALMRE